MNKIKLNKKYYLGFGIVVLMGILLGVFVSGGKIFLGDSSESVSVSSLEKGLVGHWVLDEINYNSNTNRVTDKSAYSNHGTNYGATFTEDRGGLSGGAMSFDGNDWIDLGNLGNPSSGTISLWFYKNNANTQYLLDGRGTGNWWFLTHYNSHDINFYNRVYYDNFSPGSDWYHVVVTASSSETKMYVNGELVSTGSGLSPDFRSTRIATRYTNSGYLSGNIDDVRIYDRALSEEEIQLLYDSYKPQIVSGSSQKGLILDMPLSSTYTKTETAGSEIVTDRTPYSNDGQNYGASLGGDGASFDGSGTIDGVTSGDNVGVSESITNTDNYPDGVSYSVWLNVDSDAVDRMSLFFGASTIRHIEIYSSTKKFRTEAARQNGYSFGTDNFPDDVRGVWSHFVIVFANGETNRPVRWYQNGELFHTGSMDGGTYPGTEYFSFSRIGRSTGTTSYKYAKSFDGQISNLKIYDRALSEDEVKSLYDRGRK